ncbi:MAG: NmrA family NAD(P)-binding protein, partial [Hymenobacteraceae bacterium]|nr:NmrA family NAD(P)-binding protein [Hymenobacteraceae bacterium]
MTQPTPAADPLVVIAGPTGDLGHRIARYLKQRGAAVRALVRPSSNPKVVAELRGLGVDVQEVDYANPAALTLACAGAACVVSALSGLRPVIVDTQTALLDAAVAARVLRFIPSDFCIDFTRLRPGTNRNLDFRREFGERLDRAPIGATSILNGMFADLLIGPAPVVLFPLRRVLYWGRADQPLDFTTIDNTAAFTAAAALDPT